jgi:hypothetical protein
MSVTADVAFEGRSPVDADSLQRQVSKESKDSFYFGEIAKERSLASSLPKPGGGGALRSGAATLPKPSVNGPGMASRSEGTHQMVVVQQAEGHPRVRVFAQPEAGAQVVAEVPNQVSLVTLNGEGSFVQVKGRASDGRDFTGWVGVKNIQSQQQWKGNRRLV